MEFVSARRKRDCCCLDVEVFLSCWFVEDRLCPLEISFVALRGVPPFWRSNKNCLQCPNKENIPLPLLPGEEAAII